MKIFRLIFAESFLTALMASAFPVTAMAETVVEIDTTMGAMQIELLPDEAPNTVANFMKYVEIDYYNGLIFHRVIDNWIIQAGGYDQDLNGKETFRPIRNEATNGLANERGTIAMARGADPHSANSQFFINLTENVSLNHRARTMTDYGYCVFGRVISGMETADRIGRVETHEADGFEDLPVEPVIIKSVRVLTDSRVRNRP